MIRHGSPLARRVATALPAMSPPVRSPTAVVLTTLLGSDRSEDLPRLAAVIPSATMHPGALATRPRISRNPKTP